ncbi:outer membrane beta-barrel protein [Thiofilum flexile]|uniref:outer membrane beta-barrel protein n=1 Tax=Thiofilum flexile TaxID=125627 RepID=UPI00036943DC|nr:outer membrane beta-barrel protein [Thiofilum flexile]
MKKMILLALISATSSSVFAGGWGGGGGGAYPRLGVVVTGGEAKQDASIDTSALTTRGYTVNSISTGKAKKSSGRLGFQYHFSPRWAADMGVVQFGNTDYNANLVVPVGTTPVQAARAVYDATSKRGGNRAYTAGVQYRMPIASRASVNLGVGAVAWKDKQNVTVNGTSFRFKSDGTDPYVRVGLGYDINRSMSLVTNVERYNLDEPVDRWDVGMAFRF